MNLDNLYDRKYDSANYNCAHFVCEVWKQIKNEDISTVLNGALKAPSHRLMDAHSLRAFRRLQAPSSPCVALFQLHRREPHVGIFLDGRILHLTENGVEWTYQETILVNFDKVRFYDIEKSNNC